MATADQLASSQKIAPTELPSVWYYQMDGCYGSILEIAVTN